MNKTHPIETIIIGAGFAGIAAAKKLHKANKSFIILEARDRIGGRTLTQSLDCGATIDLGAQWIGPDQHLIWEWVKSTNTPTYECYDTGKNILSINQKTSQYKGTIPNVDPLSLIGLGLAINKFNKLSQEIPLETPWTHANAKKWDGMTVATWMDKQRLTSKAKALFATAIETVFATEPDEISFLGALFYAHSGKNLDTLFAVTGGAQQTLLFNGAQQLLKDVAQPFNDRILLDQAVKNIEVDDHSVTVKTENGKFTSKHCIVTLPPALMNSIAFEPILPQMKAQLYQRMPMGAAMKCFCIYEKPFWRKKGLSGQIVTDTHPVRVTFDCSKDDNSHGILLCFVEGQAARDFIDIPPAERQQQITEGLAKYLGKEALAPIEYIDKCWTEEEYSRGCYAGLMPPGVLSKFKDTIRRPYKRIRFAGTETATEWNGYLDGAIQSGYREAAAILKMME